jgi:DNA-binding NarL/FixJ family response regulator
MTVNNNLLIQVNGSSLVQLINALDILKSNNISYTLIEEKIEAAPQIAQTKTHKLGKKGQNILALLAEGLTYNEIAEQTEVSIDGVRYYVKKIFKALGVNNGRDAVRLYLTEIKAKN